MLLDCYKVCGQNNFGSQVGIVGKAFHLCAKFRPIIVARPETYGLRLPLSPAVSLGYRPCLWCLQNTLFRAMAARLPRICCPVVRVSSTVGVWLRCEYFN